LSYRAAAVRSLPSTSDYRIVSNAGHFAFLVPCGPELTKAVNDEGEPEMCTDAAGFDRTAFHRQFDADVLAFFRRRLLETRQP
jgi:predicted dienelactone hydrolase